MADFPSTNVRINSQLSPLDDQSDFPLFDPIHGLGGFQSVANETERDAIPSRRRSEGMVVYVRGLTAYYALIGTTANAGWTTGFTFGKGGGAGDVTAAGANVFTNLNTFQAGITTSWLYASRGSTFGGTLLVLGGSTFDGRADFSESVIFNNVATFKNDVVIGPEYPVQIHSPVPGLTISFAPLVVNAGFTANTVDVSSSARFSGGITTAWLYSSLGSTFGGTLRVLGGTTLERLDVGGSAKFNGNVVLGDAGTDTVTSHATFQGITVSNAVGAFTTGITASSVYVSTGSTFGGTLLVVGGTTLSGRVDIGGIVDIVGGTTLESRLDVSGPAKFNGNVVFGDAGADTVTSHATFQGITVSNGPALMNAGLTASTLDVTNAAKFNNNVTIAGSFANTSFDTVGNATIGATLTVGGNFFVSGTVTTVNRTDLNVDDITITLGRTLANDTLVNGGGLVLKGTNDRNLQWFSGTTAWTSSQNFDVASGGSYKIAGAAALVGNRVFGLTVSNGVVGAGGVWNGAAIGLQFGGTNKDLSATGASGGIVFKDSVGFGIQSIAGSATQVLLGSANGTPTWTNLTALTGLTADTIVVNTAASGQHNIAMFAATSGSRPIFVTTGLTYDATSNILTCTKIEATIDGGVWT